MKKKILITGGFGYLGGWLTEHFFRKGFEVFLLSKKYKYDFPEVKFRFIEADITDLKELRKGLDYNFDYCLHVASMNDDFVDNYAEKALLVNALGTRNLIEVLRNSKLTKLVYFSTFHIYGASDGIINEESPANPRNDYAITHLFAEYYLREFYNLYKFPYFVLRLTNCYGAPKNRNTAKWNLVLNNLVRMSYERKKIVLNSNGKSMRDMIWMQDVCDITEKMLYADNATNEIFIASAGKSYRIIDLAKIIKQSYEKRYKRKISILINKNDRTNKPKNLLISNDKLKQTIDFRIHDMLYSEINKIFDLLER